MQNHTTHEAIAELIAEPRDMACRLFPWGGMRLHLKRRDVSRPHLSDDVDLVTPTLGAQVV
jgi:hypothetical protein